MKITPKLLHISAALICLLSAPRLHAQGSLQPPGPPAPTMKSLDEIEARIPITSVPFVITSPGSYYLTANMANEYFYDLFNHTAYNTLANTNAITILANNVTVDLNGYSITGIASSTNGILIGTVTNVTICHGSISDFGNGINAPNGVVNGRVTGVAVSDCQLSGIYLYTVNSLVESCTVNNVGSYGIVAAVVRDSSAADCGLTAIYGHHVSDSSGTSNGGDGIDGDTIHNSEGAANGSGSGIFAFQIAADCYGTSVSGDGIEADNAAANCRCSTTGGQFGLDAVSASNCEGQNLGSGTGVRVYDSAANCYGTSVSGTGLFANNAAANCTGLTTGGQYGLFAASASSCTGINQGSGTGLYGDPVCVGCYGTSQTGTGLIAVIAESCAGYSFSGTAINITHTANSFGL